MAFVKTTISRDIRSMKRYYVTTPIYYVNGLPHVGTATTTLLADAVKRYRNLRGERAYMLTGTDEHAQKVADAAAKVGKPTQAFVDEVSQRFVEAWQYLGCDYDNFIRTSEPRHKAVVQEVFRRLEARGDIYLGVYEGWYSVSDETFFRDSDVDGNGFVKETGAKVERIKEDVYYFKLSAYGEKLKAHIDANPDFLLPETRRNEVLSFIDDGLRDIALTRKNKGWGIEVPGHPEHVFYVWFDALINYLTESGWPDNPDFDTLWPADAHLMAKEIYTRFHATFWPAMLMGLELPLPKHIVGHGWWLIGGEKGAKSKGNIPGAQEVVTYLQDASGAPEAICKDALRYYLVRDIALSSDAEFSLEMLVTRYNGDLANDLGNVLNRVLRAKYFTGTIPTPLSIDAELVQIASEAVKGYEAALTRFNWGAALQAAWTLVSATNKYLDEKAPWIREKEGDVVGRDTAVYNALEATRLSAYLLSPVMPYASKEIAAQLGITDFNSDGSWAANTTFGKLVSGTPIGTPTPLFPRIDIKQLKENIKKMEEEKKEIAPTELAPAPTEEETPVEEPITIDDFFKVQLKVADIVAVEKVPKADKLLQLSLKIGEEERIILSAIAEFYEPEELVGKQIVVVYNLAPRKMRGIESKGMLLAATNDEGKPILLTPESHVSSGTSVG
jgi:methionyl-tRNA synthetase